jgi:hypothetical protein
MMPSDFYKLGLVAHDLKRMSSDWGALVDESDVLVATPVAVEQQRILVVLRLVVDLSRHQMAMFGNNINISTGVLR